MRLCQKTININLRVSTYCMLYENHDGECEPQLERWEIELAKKIWEKQGFILVNKNEYECLKLSQSLSTELNKRKETELIAKLPVSV